MLGHKPRGCRAHVHQAQEEVHSPARETRGRRDLAPKNRKKGAQSNGLVKKGRNSPLCITDLSEGLDPHRINTSVGSMNRNNVKRLHSASARSFNKVKEVYINICHTHLNFLIKT